MKIGDVVDMPDDFGVGTINSQSDNSGTLLFRVVDGNTERWFEPKYLQKSN